MEGQLKKGTVLVSENETEYTINELIGSGGQGEVYDVESDGKHYALKWYYKHMATRQQKENLENLIEKGSPDGLFLWPQDLVFEKEGEPFGYIMPLRPEEYKSIVDMMKRKAEPSFYTLCRVAYNLTRGYQLLHAKGYCYKDISFGNVFFDPDTGEVLICDNDNVAVNGSDDSTVYGTPRFMAPEIVCGKAKPSRNTDMFSLAVLLFYMFMLNHPLEGKLEAKIKCMDIHAMNQLYGINPVFIYDPEDKSNRPLAGYQDNAIIFWELYPQSLKDLFTASFTVGLTQPNRRITEAKWLEAFANLMTGIVICPDCGAEVFYDAAKEEWNKEHICWNCKKTVTIPSKIVIGKNRVLINSETKLYSHHINGDYNMETVVGVVVQNPNNPLLWGIRNVGMDSWTYIKADGTQIPVPVGRTAAIVKGTRIHFGTEIGEFA